ncbi:MAG: hypothetical protein ACN6OC_10885 [Alcaligenes sp.]
MSSTNTQAQAMPSRKQILEVADEVHQSGWNMDGVPDGMLIDFAEMILSRYGAGQPAASAEPLRVFAQECAMGAYQESELREAALQALKYATAPVSAGPVAIPDFVRETIHSALIRDHDTATNTSRQNDVDAALNWLATSMSAAPVGWLRNERGLATGPATLDPLFLLGATQPHGYRATYSPVVYAAPVAAQAQPERPELQEARHDSAHAETESERVRALAYWLEQQTYEPDMLSNAADTLRAYLEEKNQAQPLPDSLVPTAPDLEYLRDAAENTALPAFLRGQIAAAVKALAAQAQPSLTVPAETLRVCGVIADKIEDGSLFRAGIYRNSELAGFVRQVLRVVSSAQAQQDANMISCGCGDLYPSNSYGAGFIAAAGHCENCDAAQDHELLGPDADPIRALLAERDVLRDALAGVLVDDLLPLLPAEYIAKVRAALAQNVDAEPAP